jgi:hypothetical protein
LPGGSPSYADPYLYQNRLNDYRRVDVGFSKVLLMPLGSQKQIGWEISKNLLSGWKFSIYLTIKMQ